MPNLRFVRAQSASLSSTPWVPAPCTVRSCVFLLSFLAKGFPPGPRLHPSCWQWKGPPFSCGGCWFVERNLSCFCFATLFLVFLGRRRLVDGVWAWISEVREWQQEGSLPSSLAMGDKLVPWQMVQASWTRWIVVPSLHVLAGLRLQSKDGH